ncbi:MAG: type VI secretion system tip protein TssI/VgrG [Pseudomonadota bacterium]
MASYDQSGRLLRIDSSLGPNKVLLVDMDGTEALSRPFLFNITLASDEPQDKVKKLLSEAVTLWVGAEGEPDSRPFHGMIRRISRHHSGRGDDYVWRAEVVPALWFLSCKADCRIFQNMTVLQVLDKLFKLHGVNFTEDRTTKTYPVMKYCVQYRETALDFASRLMEEFGITYWHEHEAKKHVLVFTDVNIKAKMLKPDTLTYGGIGAGEKLHLLEQDLEFRVGAFATRDYNFKTPGALSAREPTALSIPRMSDHEVFDYPGRHQTSARGGELARVRIEEQEAQHMIFRGAGDTRTLTAGCRVNVDDVHGAGKELVLVTSVRHFARDTSFWATEADGSRYRNEFTAIPAKVPHRPARITPRPVIQGPQTATVTGPSGSEIHTDKWGRVVVRFHWDRNPDGSKDESCSCWVRVSQGWAGKGWGMMHIPRVGHEVVVDFLEGDPDRPLITGRVYNNDNMPPWALPANKTQSGIKSDSSLGGGGWNEFRFEDKKGSEQVYFQAEKDLDSLIKNNETRKVGVDRTTNIGSNDKLIIGKNLTTEVGIDKKTTVGANFDETITGNETRMVAGNIQETVGGNETRMIGGSIMETVGGGTTHIDGGSVTYVAASGINLVSPAAINIASGTAVNVVAPAQAQVAPSWLQTGTNTGTIYANQMQVAMNVLNMAGNQIAVIGNSLAVTNTVIALTGIKMDNCMLDLSSGPLYVRKAGVIVQA